MKPVKVSGRFELMAICINIYYRLPNNFCLVFQMSGIRVSVITLLCVLYTVTESAVLISDIGMHRMIELNSKRPFCKSHVDRLKIIATLFIKAFPIFNCILLRFKLICFWSFIYIENIEVIFKECF